MSFICYDINFRRYKLTLTVNISKDSELYEDVYLVIDNRKILLDSLGDASVISDLSEGTYAFDIYTKTAKKALSYILVWFIKLLILPFNLLLMNTDSDWYNNLIAPTSLFYRASLELTSDTEITVKVNSSSLKSVFIKGYDIELISNAKIEKLSCVEQINTHSISWEMNNYLSKLFSYCLLGALLCSLSILSEWAFKWYFAIFMSSAFLMIFLGVTLYSFKKAKKIKARIKAYCENKD